MDVELCFYKVYFLFKSVEHLQNLIIRGHKQISCFLKDVTQTMLSEDTTIKLEISQRYNAQP